MKKLVVAFAVLCLLPALVSADECTDSCDAQLASALADCQDFADYADQCDQEYFFATDQCQSNLDNCLDDCAGDPGCEASCYATFDQCNQMAADENESCLSMGEEEFSNCVSSATYDHEECLQACGPVSTEGATWGNLKVRFH